MDVLETVSADMNIEKIVLAEEIRADNPVVLERILALCEKLPKQCQVEYISHEDLKLQLKTCRAVIPYPGKQPLIQISFCSPDAGFKDCLRNAKM